MAVESFLHFARKIPVMTISLIHPNNPMRWNSACVTAIRFDSVKSHSHAPDTSIEAIDAEM